MASEGSTGEVGATVTGNGWAAGNVDAMGEGPGFRKVRRELGVTAFGVNAIVLSPAYSTGGHRHERQEELYIVQSGTVELTFGDGDEDGESVVLGPGGMARVDASTVRRMRNVSSTDEAVYVCVGAADGYVGRDGVAIDG